MDIKEHELVILAEEVVELIEACFKFHHAISKSLRFSENEINPVTSNTAKEDFIREARDVRVLLDRIVISHGYHEINDPDLITRKHNKVNRMIEASKNQGTIKPSIQDSVHFHDLNRDKTNTNMEVIPVEVFLKALTKGLYTSEEGFGFWADETKESVYDVRKVLRPDWATHVVWYNNSKKKTSLYK